MIRITIRVENLSGNFIFAGKFSSKDAISSQDLDKSLAANKLYYYDQRY
jgi:hypothetical protein